MTYLQFHLVFILPPLLALALTTRGPLRRLPPRSARWLPAIALLALAWTTPWDNYLVWRGVWGYGADRVIGTIGYVPVEEYLFFVLQPLLSGLWLFRVLAHRPATPAPQHGKRGAMVRAAGALAYFALALWGAMLLRTEQGTYLGLILAWAAPVLGLQWAYAGAEVWARRGAWAAGVAIPTLYLWVADWTAIRLGIWTIAEQFTTGLSLNGLPVEEAVFFLITNLLVVQGLLLFLFPPRREAAATEPEFPSAPTPGDPERRWTVMRVRPGPRAAGRWPVAAGWRRRRDGGR